eukprot:9941429-Ditylum_brightwellii.AAC.2
MIAAYMEADLEMEENERVSFKTVLISDEEEESSEYDASLMIDKPSTKENITTFMDANELPLPLLQQISAADEREVLAMTPQAKLLRWHYFLDHLSFRKIQIMAALGLLP